MDNQMTLPAQADDGLHPPDHLDRNKPKTPSWRDILPVHPAAELCDRMTPEELIELGNDIKAYGLRIPITLWRGPDDNGYQVLDGCHRLDAMERVGIKFKLVCRSLGWMIDSDVTGKMPGKSVSILGEQQDPYAFVISVNIKRRHFSVEGRRKAIDALIKLNVGKSDRAIAKMIGVDHKTIGAARHRGEELGNIPQLDKTTGADGKARPAKKAKPSPEEAATVARFKAAVNWHAEAEAELAQMERDRAECIALNNKCIEAKRELAEFKAGQKIITADERKRAHEAEEARTLYEAAKRPFNSQKIIDSGPIDARDKLDDVPPEKWHDLMLARKTSLAIHISYHCKCLLEYIDDAKRMYQVLGFNSAEHMIREGYDIKPEEVELAIEWLRIKPA